MCLGRIRAPSVAAAGLEGLSFALPAHEDQGMTATGPLHQQGPGQGGGELVCVCRRSADDGGGSGGAVLLPCVV